MRSVQCAFQVAILFSLLAIPSWGEENRVDLISTILTEREVSPPIKDEPDYFAKSIVNWNRRYNKLFKLSGDIYRHYPGPKQSEACLEGGDCYGEQVVFQYQQLNLEFPFFNTPAAPRDFEYLNRVLDEQNASEELWRSQAAFIAQIVQEKPDRVFGDSAASKTVYLLQTKHPLDVKRETALQVFLERFPQGVSFKQFNQEAHPKLFAILGTRFQGAILYQGKLMKDVSTLAQWEEIIFGSRLLRRVDPSLHNIPIFDAHQHIVSGGGERLVSLMRENGLGQGLIIAVNQGERGDELKRINDEVLSVAKIKDAHLFPLVTLASDDPENMKLFTNYLKAGARGLKLNNGHGVFSPTSRPPLDPPELRNVFAYCEKQGLPVLWHVNTHLYREGFIRALNDFPQLKVVNPHFAGYLTYAPNIMRSLLTKYPNLMFDISIGPEPMLFRRAVEDLSLQHDEWRRLFIDFQDRILFGVDMLVTAEYSSAYAEMLYTTYRNLLEKESYDFNYFQERGYSTFFEQSHNRNGLRGLALPPDVLKKIYWENAVKLYGTR